MPKVKTHSRAKKTFKITASGEFKYQRPFKRHILTKKSKNRKRHLNQAGIVSPANKPFVMRLLRLK
ncbi:MAG: 50S ribosomal protein L35 [Chitinophagaceae bacterium]